MSPDQKVWLEKAVISYGNMNPKEVFNTFHKLKPLSLNSLERIRNWKKSLSTLTRSVMLMNSCGAWPDAAYSESAVKIWAQFCPEKGISQLQAHPDETDPSVPPSPGTFSGVAEVPGLHFGTGFLDSPTSKCPCPNVRGFLSGERQTSALSRWTYLAEQEIPRWSGGILKG